jgi:diguanylate cyclase (GGDEF)-like protein
MVLRDPAVIAYAAAAVALAVVAVIAWRRRAHNLTLGAALTVVMVGACWWAVSFIVPRVATNVTVAAIAKLATFPGPSTMSAAFVCLGLAIARPQWVPRRAVILALLVEPALITLAGLTNPWHLLVYRGAGAAQLTGPAGWTYGPLFWLDTWFTYLEMVIGLGAIAWAWWKASPAFRRQRLAVFLAALIPFAANVVFLVGGLDNVLDPTPLGLAVTGTIVWYVVFRQELITFSPVARALIIDQIGDAVVVISPAGRVLDLNPAAVDLLRGMNPHAPTKLVGASAQEVFGDGLIAAIDGRETEVVVELAGVRAEFQVRASLLADRYHRGLGTVFVARDVTEANAVTRRLGVAHAQLVRQVETIERLRVDLVELASRDPLTGLHNRRHMVEGFASMIAAAERSGEPLAVALFDVDRFKAVNDDYGHLAGDAVLVGLAQLMSERPPAGALVARWGGEEFFVALPGADAATGLAFADDLRRRCELNAIVVEGRMIRCTLSGGVAAYPASGTTMDELFHAVDVSMYEAKNAGRNLVRLHLGRAPSTAVDAEVL